MDNLKIDDLLQLAFYANEEKLAAYFPLGIGYHPTQKTFEVLIRYEAHKTLLELADHLQVTIEPLLFGFGIATGTKQALKALANSEKLLFMENPKAFSFQDITGKDMSCLPIYSKDIDSPLTGKGTLLGIIDSGLDIYQKEFQTEDGKTRVIALFDEARKTIYSRAQLQEAIDGKTEKIIFDHTGHGTAVASIAGASNTIYAGVAEKAEFLIVKVTGKSDQAGLYYTSTLDIIRGITWLMETAATLSRPLAVNISLGSVYGPHNGNGLLDQYLDLIAGYHPSLICVGTGNEGNQNGHVSCHLGGIWNAEKNFALQIGPYEQSISMQVWLTQNLEADLTLQSPDGNTYSFSSGKEEQVLIQKENLSLLVSVMGPTPYRQERELFFLWSGSEQAISEQTALNSTISHLPQGIWNIRVTAQGQTAGTAEFYLPSATGRNQRTGFTENDPHATITIPATAKKVLSVAAYHPYQRTYASFSGRGYVTGTGENNGPVNVKPEISAPGEQILSLTVEQGKPVYRPMSGTSFATPFVTGTAALLMEWGIIEKNDPYLYGDRLKFALIAGAEKQIKETEYPNEKTGYGALCAKKSLRILKERLTKNSISYSSRK